ncbi:MAG: hypothetical protein OXB95_00760 [Rhodobacteraceae bacterium]|nr:hypothetical protein [Paracoccaceae bacterium]
MANDSSGAPPAWTDEQVKVATSMWKECHTAAEIGDLIGKTRRAVIGKMYRLKIKRGSAMDDAGGAAGQSPGQGDKAGGQEGVENADGNDQEASASGSEDQPSDADSESEAIGDRRTVLMQLTERTCRWPIGDPSTQNFWFCGKNTVQAGKPYCEEHSALAYHPHLTKRERRDLKTQYNQGFKHRIYTPPPAPGTRK